MVRASVEANTYEAWRNAARPLLRERVPPEDVVWTVHPDQPLLFEPERVESAEGPSSLLIPRSFVTLARMVSRHADPKRWSLLYRVAWRLTAGEKHLIELETDDDVAALNAMRRAVEKDIYRMRAFVRFRKVAGENCEEFVAWYEPEHRTLDANGHFFVERFGSMRWAILTPDSSMMWDLERLQTGPGVPRSLMPAEDALEDLWRLYYQTIYNPARLKIPAMRAQLPVKRWRDLPETRAIPELVRLSRGRVQQMAAEQPRSAAEFVPAGATLPVLCEAVRRCGACDLCGRATQPVWGEGSAQARLMLVGEQPGDEEDLTGRPFVGPAGQVLDRALEQAGIFRPDLYLTNAVKAFRFEERGKRRIHQTPRSREIAACRPWLAAEIGAVRPGVILCLGASAGQSVFGRKMQVGAERGRLLAHPAASYAAVTYHPSAILRAPDSGQAEDLFAMLVADLAMAKAAAA
jgi:probable DNA metabolism protein